jgi:hypothetical protein
VKRRSLRWAGYVARKREKNNANMILIWNHLDKGNLKEKQEQIERKR